MDRVFVCWSDLLGEFPKRGRFHVPLGDSRTLCGLRSETWYKAAHGPDDPGVTCERCLKVRATLRAEADKLNTSLAEAGRKAPTPDRRA